MRFSDHSRLPRLLPALLLTALAGLSACRENQSQGTPDAGGTNDASAPLTCRSMADCGGTGICVGGLCESVTPCLQDDECGDGQVCHTTRGYCVECDGLHSGECPADYTCQFDFTCVPLGGGTDGGVGDGGNQCSGSCTDRSECSLDQVCSAEGSCCPPPPRCFSPSDCPTNRPECNGATGVCFGGDSCINDTDCNSQPGCMGGVCRCDPQTTTCTVRENECQNDPDCYDNGQFAGKICILNSSPTRCADAPNCTSNANCAPLGLICDLGDGASPTYQRCTNGAPCNAGMPCPTGQFCGTAGLCVVDNCVNNPSLCTGTQTCEPTSGQCIDNPLGPCPNGDSDCQAGYYCEPSTTPAPACRLGCRSNADCPGGVCNASHQCEGGMMGGPGGACASCADDTECNAGLSCVVGFCRNPCVDPADCMGVGTENCILFNCACLL